MGYGADIRSFLRGKVVEGRQSAAPSLVNVNHTLSRTPLQTFALRLPARPAMVKERVGERHAPGFHRKRSAVP